MLHWFVRELNELQEKSREERGFTLIELLVVIIIIGILAAIAIPTYLNQRENAQESAVQSDLRVAATEAESYFVDNQSYEDFELPDNFDESQNVTISVDDANLTEDNFCITGDHSQVEGDPDFSFDSDRTGEDQQQLASGGCG